MGTTPRVNSGIANAARSNADHAVPNQIAAGVVSSFQNDTRCDLIGIIICSIHKFVKLSMVPPMDPIIQTVELHKHFGRVRALDGLNLEVRGEIHGFLGPNGAGKSIYLAVPALVSVLWPRATIGVGWALLAAGVVLGIFGGMVGLNQDIRNISPFSHTPVPNGTTTNWSGAWWMLAIAVVTGAVAVVVMRRRETGTA